VPIDSLKFDKEKFLKKDSPQKKFFEDTLHKSNIYLLDNVKNIPGDPYIKHPTGKGNSILSN